ncbi:formylglycine-generating enzyme family protein [Pseudooceanicola sp. C21-150M6]|uniref:formylglycine-generating enzyme family protein n=1 Tax=Pseudooceanicola sp. C21-150M6 TaxID=3434355 RepID=UPI003D7F892A
MRLLSPAFVGAAALAVLSTTSVFAQEAPAEISWPDKMIDPAAEAGAPADLMLPMPCGAGMAFQRVDIPVDSADPLSDMRVRLGQSNPDTGFSDYLRTEFLRGPFVDEAQAQTYFYIARYELSVGQYRALSGDCAAPSGPDRLAKGGLSWFDAVALSRDYSEWLIANAAEALPSQGGRRGFVRLPTETEWEFATRGGSRIDPARYPGRRFFEEGELADYALFADGRRGAPGPIGIRKANPLGLFDVYGNAEELMLEPFRMNALGRQHGQAGGLVTRGGSLDASEAQIYSAQRTEYPMYSPGGSQALAGDYFGVRLVLSTHVVSEEVFDTLQQSWIAQSEEGNAATGDAMTQLTALVKSELDPRRQTALSGVQLQFRRAQEDASLAQVESARATMLSVGAFMDVLRKDAGEIDRLQRYNLELADRIRISSGQERGVLLSTMRQSVDSITGLRGVQETYLLVLRTALTTLASDITPDQLQSAYDGLVQRLENAKQSVVVAQVNSAWQLLDKFKSAPDIGQPELLTLVLG